LHGTELWAEYCSKDSFFQIYRKKLNLITDVLVLINQDVIKLSNSKYSRSHSTLFLNNHPIFIVVDLAKVNLANQFSISDDNII
jgi:hypothetical protein